MLVSSEGIVLHQLKYSDNKIIITLFTRKMGRQSFIMYAPRSKRSGNKSGFLQPLFLVDLVAYQKQNREINLIKEIKISPVYQSIPFDVVKSTQSIFLAEVLGKTLIGQESNPDTFDFLKNILLFFDLLEESPANFHLYFLFRFTEFLGLLPDLSQVGFEGWFDMKKGAIVPFEPPHPFFMHKEATGYLMELATLRLKDLPGFRLPATMRDYLLVKWIEYYQLHMPHMGNIKSLEVLREVFN